MGTVIRTARLADRPRILAISAGIWEGYDYVPAVLSDWMLMRDSEVVVAEIDGVVSAFARTVTMAPAYVWLEGIRSDPAMQGHGAGKAITEYFIEKAVREGARRIGLSTYVDNLASIHIVEKNGFTRQAMFILCEATRESPARALAMHARDVIAVEHAETLAFIAGSSALKAGRGFLPQGWKFWPMARSVEHLVPPLAAAVGLRNRDGSLRALLAWCRPDHGCAEATIDFVEGNAEDTDMLIRHFLALNPGTETIQAIVPDPGALHSVTLATLTAFEFDVWKYGEPDVFVYERSL
jgi:GNAT superfamily N-acetyltransferase